MMAHELLRQAALILAAGWSKGADARDAAGRIVPLYVGPARATINPEAVAFSPYGAICKAAADTRSQLPRVMWDTLAELASKRGRGVTHPLRYINEAEDVTSAEVIALLNEAADMIDPANTEPRTARASNRATKSAQERGDNAGPGARPD
jgi:hypothetical protein